MKLNVSDTEAWPRDLSFTEPTGELTRELEHGGVQDFEFGGPTRVDLHCDRVESDIIVRGRIGCSIVGHCARCLEDYPFDLECDVAAICLPRSENGAESDTDEGDDIVYYDGDEIDLTPIIRERIILALPTRPLCSPDCKGLCPQCGTNLNQQSCQCRTEKGDPRLAVLRNLKVSH